MRLKAELTIISSERSRATNLQLFFKLKKRAPATADQLNNRVFLSRTKLSADSYPEEI